MNETKLCRVNPSRHRRIGMLLCPQKFTTVIKIVTNTKLTAEIDRALTFKALPTKLYDDKDVKFSVRLILYIVNLMVECFIFLSLCNFFDLKLIK